MNLQQEDELCKQWVSDISKENEQKNKAKLEESIKRFDDINKAADKVDLGPWDNYIVVRKGKRFDIIQNIEGTRFRLREKISGKQFEQWFFKEQLDDVFSELNKGEGSE